MLSDGSTWRRLRGRLGQALGACAVVSMMVLSARCDRQEKKAPFGPASGEVVGTLDFPVEAASDDPAVNEVVRSSLLACLRGDYNRFRSHWSPTEEPLRRQQFERSWQPIRKIAVATVQPMRHADHGGLLYYVHARLEFGPGAKQTSREVVVLIVREGESWHLARAPKSLVKQLLQTDADPEGL